MAPAANKQRANKNEDLFTAWLKEWIDIRLSFIRELIK